MDRFHATATAAAILPDETPDGDRRSEDRQHVLYAARIKFIGEETFIDCAIVDISLHGARLRPVDATHCPDLFELDCPDRFVKRCTVVWRDGNWIGVKFE